MAFSARLPCILLLLAALLACSFPVSLQQEDYCVRDVDLDKEVVFMATQREGRVHPAGRYPLSFEGPSFFVKPTVLRFVRFHFLNLSGIYGYFTIFAFDDISEEEQPGRPNDTFSGPTFLASSSQFYTSLGAAAWDVLTLGSTDASDRTNITSILLPFHACPGPNVYNKIFRTVLRASGIDDDKSELRLLNGVSSVRSSQVHLFMPLGLISLFLTFLLLPFLSLVLHAQLAPRVTPQRLQTAELSLLSTASLVAWFFIVYWVIAAVFYYCRFSETVDGALFSDPFFSPMSQCMLFYFLSGLVSFVGGMVFSQCRKLGKPHFTCCQIMGKGLLSACTTAAFFHSFFLILAFFEDPVSTLSNLVTLFTVIILLFLALFAIFEQYRKTRFQGNFILVVMMQMTLSSIYYILIISFREITCENDGNIATGSYLCLVIVISTTCVLLALAIIMMMSNKKKKTLPKNNDPESGNTANKAQPAEGGKEKVSGEAGLVRSGNHNSATLAAVARDMGFIVLIPGVVQTWQKRQKRNEATVTT